MLTFVASVFVFGILIFFHELGHFTVAVGETKSTSSALVLAQNSLPFPERKPAITCTSSLRRFVRMAGMDPNEKDEDDGRRFSTTGQRSGNFCRTFNELTGCPALSTILFSGNPGINRNQQSFRISRSKVWHPGW